MGGELLANRRVERISRFRAVDAQEGDAPVEALQDGLGYGCSAVTPF
jgi:hypothetical protein